MPPVIRAVAGLLATTVHVACCSASGAVQLPHVVFLLADDLGWSDVGFREGSDVLTPHIDAIAAAGLKLDYLYTQLVCSPSRGAIMTAKYPYKLGLSHGFIAAGAPYGLPLSERTMAQELTAHGWSSHMVGKWHLGMASWAYTPTYRGFSTHFGFYNGATDYWAHCHPEKTPDGPLDMHWGSAPHTPAVPVTAFNGTLPRNNSDYGPFLFATETIRLLDAHVAASAAAGGAMKPLFLYLPHQSVHEPLQAPQAYVQRCAGTVPASQPERRVFCGMVGALDDAIHSVQQRMEVLGLWDTTLFVFQADNGGNLAMSGNNQPLRGGKYTLFEGGCRATAFLSGGALPQSVRGTTSGVLMHEVDWLPTLLSLAGAKPSGIDLDGVDQWGALTGGADAVRTTVIYNIDPVANLSAIRVGDWKLIDGASMSPDVRPTAGQGYKPLCQGNATGTGSGGDCLAELHSRGPWLFNLRTDPHEALNLYGSESARAAELHARLSSAAASPSMRYPINAPGSPGAIKAPLSVSCPHGIWTPWLA